jgi:hypothetical protein
MRNIMPEIDGMSLVSILGKIEGCKIKPIDKERLLATVAWTVG